MARKHLKVLEEIQKKPTPSNIRWHDIENALLSLGAQMTEGNGSRVRFDLNGITLSAHRPHPQKEAKRYQVRDVVDFLKSAGVIDSQA
jgi:hypothetical protein